jgi:hypothetical protein
MPLFPNRQWVIACCLLICGCGRAEFVAVTGKVTLAGKPLTAGMVTFVGVNGDQIGYGQIQPDGSYSLSTGNRKGVKPGTYNVSVVATMPAIMTAHEKSDGLPTLVTPARYADAETSGLQCQVPSEGIDYAIDL